MMIFIVVVVADVVDVAVAVVVVVVLVIVAIGNLILKSLFCIVKQYSTWEPYNQKTFIL